jgi:tetratricopeptide (TPR) repeat protein
MGCKKKHVLCFDCVYDWQDEVDETGTIDWCVTCPCGMGDSVDVQVQAKEKADIYMWYAETHSICKHAKAKYFTYALQEHEKILKLIPDHISSSYSTAILLNLCQRREEALKLFDNIDSWVRALGPDYNWLTRPDIALSRADALMALGRWREAMAIYKHQQQVIENSDYKIDRYKTYLKQSIPFSVAECMIELGMYQEALDHIDRTITILGRRVCRSHKLKALALKGLGDLDGAIETINRGILYEDPFQSKNKIENFQFYEELCALKQNHTSNNIQSDMHANVSSHVDDVMDEAPALFGDGVEDGPGFLKRVMSHGRKDRRGRTHLSEFLVKSIRMIDDDVNDYDDENPNIISFNSNE